MDLFANIYTCLFHLSWETLTAVECVLMDLVRTVDEDYNLSNVMEICSATVWETCNATVWVICNVRAWVICNAWSSILLSS